MLGQYVVVRSKSLAFIIGGQADFLCLMAELVSRLAKEQLEACVSRQAGAFAKVDKSEWTNWCKGEAGKTADATGSFIIMCFWHQDIASGYSIKWHLLQLPFDR